MHVFIKMIYNLHKKIRTLKINHVLSLKMRSIDDIITVYNDLEDIKMRALPEYMLAAPTVFAVGDKYNIFVPFSDEVIMWVRVGDRNYYDHCNGIMRSNTNMHKAELPMSVLDDAEEYTVVYKKMIDRKPYFPTSEPEREFTVRFRPVPQEGDINIYHIADAHNLVEEPVMAGRYFGDDINLLVLNGDIPNHSGDIKNFNAICEIAAGVTGGHCPCVFARGNHDTRGIHAEDMPYYIPTMNGKTYYTFKVGCVWGLLLDCGEDKRDTNDEYGGTICFHLFREEETDFIKEVIANADREYNAPDVKHRLVISHISFFHIDRPPFDIEKELYAEWARLMREYIKPDLLLHGHYHVVDIVPAGAPFDNQGQPCTAIIGAEPKFADANRPNAFTGAGIVLSDDGNKRIIFNNEKGEVIRDELID